MYLNDFEDASSGDSSVIELLERRGVEIGSLGIESCG